MSLISCYISSSYLPNSFTYYLVDPSDINSQHDIVQIPPYTLPINISGKTIYITQNSKRFIILKVIYLRTY